MLTIRSDQMAVLQYHAMRNRLTLHARDVAPQLCAHLSNEEFDAVVDYCLARCRYYGISRDFDVLRYMNLMLVFGFTFDTERWAAQALAFPNPKGRMELLMDRALSQSASCVTEA